MAIAATDAPAASTGMGANVLLPTLREFKLGHYPARPWFGRRPARSNQ